MKYIKNFLIFTLLIFMTQHYCMTRGARGIGSPAGAGGIGQTTGVGGIGRVDGVNRATSPIGSSHIGTPGEGPIMEKIKAEITEKIMEKVAEKTGGSAGSGAMMEKIKAMMASK